MTSASQKALRAHIPFRSWILGLSAFSALSALGGGIELVGLAHGSPYVPITLLEHTVFDSFLVPGLLLLLVVGGTSLACSLFAWAHSKRTISATWLAGGTLTSWIVAEAAQMGEVHPLQIVYGLLGMSLLALAAFGAHQTRDRTATWIVGVSLAEGTGFLVPVLTALALTQSHVGEGLQALVIGLAGGVEGAFLGTGQALAWTLPIRRWRYVLLTAVAAAGVWWLVLFGRLALLPLARSLPMVAATLACLLGVAALAAIGGLQALELRRVTRGAGRWIAWTALAWILALPMSFLPSPLVDVTTPWWVQLPLWAIAGFIMAYVMALVTERGARQLERLAPR